MEIDRRKFIAGSLELAALAALGIPVLSATSAADGNPNTSYAVGFDGSNEPDPTPWLDKNGSHNQSPGPNLDPASIYHFKGRVARCNNFSGMGTDNNGSRIAFGAPSTDFSFMQGEYFSGRSSHSGTFSHI